MTRRCLTVLVLALSLARPLQAQEEAKPAPYLPEEFPDPALKLRRAEIIAFGILPFAFLLTTLTYDFVRYGSNGFDQRYAPGPFKAPGGADLTDQERLGVIGVSISLSVLAAGIDWFLGTLEEPERPPPGAPTGETSGPP